MTDVAVTAAGVTDAAVTAAAVTAVVAPSGSTSLGRRTPPWLLESAARPPLSRNGRRARRSFVAKTLAAGAGLLRRVMFSEDVATSPGVLQRVDPRVKIVSLLTDKDRLPAEAGLKVFSKSGKELMSRTLKLPSYETPKWLKTDAGRDYVDAKVPQPWTKPAIAGRSVAQGILVVGGLPAQSRWPDRRRLHPVCK